MNENLDVCVVVPAYNEASILSKVLSGLQETFPHIICVDDGSTDGSAEIARSAGVLVVRHALNAGQGAALQTGFSFALGIPEMRYVITFDADGQHRVEDAAHMLDVARNHDVDVVFGSRFLDQGPQDIPTGRRALLRAAVLFTRLTSGVHLTDTHNGLRVLNRHAVNTLNITLHGMSHASELIDQVARRGLRWVEHPVTIDYTEYSRAKGQQNINALNVSLDVLGQKLRASR